MRTQMPKQKNRLPSTYGKRRGGVCGQSRATLVLGPLPGSHEETHKEEEVENEEEVLDEAEATLLG